MSLRAYILFELNLYRKISFNTQLQTCIGMKHAISPKYEYGNSQSSSTDSLAVATANTSVKFVKPSRNCK